MNITANIFSKIQEEMRLISTLLIYQFTESSGAVEQVSLHPVKLSDGMESRVNLYQGGQWLSGRVLDSRLRGGRFEPQRLHCVVSLSNPSLVLVQPRKTCPFITEILLMGCKESIKQTKSGSHHSLRSGLIWVNTVCSGLSVWVLMLNILNDSFKNVIDSNN